MNKTLKIYQRMILLVLIVILSNQNLFSQPDDIEGDLGFKRTYGYNTFTIMEAVSAPFEGVTSPKLEYLPYNRVEQIQNGAYYRYYITQNTHKKSQISYITGVDEGILNGYYIDRAHCSGNEEPLLSLGNWGFAKYKITIRVQQLSLPNNIFIFKFYLNCLDSKYQDDRNQGGYGADLKIEFQPINEQNIPRIRFYKWAYSYGEETIGYIYTTDILNGEPTKEYKVWEVVPQTPVNPTKNFFAKTTPFPICPRMINSHKIRVLELGTEVALNGVYSYLGDNDIFGYNTIDSLNAWSYDYYSNPPIITGANVTGKTYVTPATFYEDGTDNKVFGFRLNVKEGNKISIINDHRLWISGYNNSGTYKGDTICFSPGSQLVMESYAQLNACRGGKIIDSNATITWNPNAFMRIYEFSEIAFSLNNNVVNNGGHIEVDGFGTFKVCDNSTVTFDGAGTYLKLNTNSIVQLGENAKIEFKNGAYLIANGGTISSLNASTPGKGLVFENAGAQTSIMNCTFTNLTKSIYFYNNIAGYVGINRYINNNTFITNDQCYSAIETESVNNATITNNHIYMNTGKGIGIYMRYPVNYNENETSSIPFFVNIVGNEISNGNLSAAFLSTTNSYAGINFKYNNCYGNVTQKNIYMRQIMGDFKHNNFNSVSGVTIDLYQSTPNVYKNDMFTSGENIRNNNSYPKFAPLPDEIGDGGWIWFGGYNNITSSGNNNIYFNDGNVLLDWGRNCFMRNNNYKHLYGFINEPLEFYYVRDNDFNTNSNPVTDLHRTSDGSIVNPYSTGSIFSCNNSSDAGTIWLINDLGNGFYDTLYKTSNNTSYQPPQDEAIYSTAMQKKTMNQNFDAVTYFKSLINLYPTSYYTDASLYSMYECYQKLDTSNNQGIRDILYTDLKNYLDGKILSGIYSDEFNYTAYNIAMMCLASIQEYNEAMTGYEFIALYHPDAYTRLLASWDYAEVQQLLNGSGGISSKEENLTDEDYLKMHEKHFRKAINEDPIKKKVKKLFDKIKTEKTSKVEKDAIAKTNDEKSAKLEVAKMNQKDEMMSSKVISVMRYSKTLTKEEREKLKTEDILFFNKTESKNEIMVNTNVPEVYTLSQNYPNPFNPTTKINFALPKQGFVTLKIYDITGREIKTLVNEVKQAGYYSVDFNGSSFASGVYFCRIQSGDFISVKRMVLVK